MTLEEFINEHLCPAGIVTAWDAQVITIAYRLGDTQTLTAKITGLDEEADILLPAKFENNTDIVTEWFDSLSAKNNYP